MDNGESSYRRYLDGEDAAFDQVQQAYFDSLTFFINRIVHNEAVAEDLAIDTMAELIVHKGRYRFGSSLKTYLFTMGRSKALDHLRRQKRITFIPLEDVPNQASQGSLEKSFLQDQRARELNAAIRNLPEQMQIAIHLVYFEGLSYDEAAKVMKKSRKQIDNLLYRAKSALRSILGKECEPL